MAKPCGRETTEATPLPSENPNIRRLLTPSRWINAARGVERGPEAVEIPTYYTRQSCINRHMRSLVRTPG